MRFYVTWKKRLFVAVTILCSASTLTSQQQNPYFDQLPALTLELHANGTIHTTYAKLKTEAHYSLWIAFDNKNNKLLYKVLPQDTFARFFDLQHIIDQAKMAIAEHEPLIKAYLQDIVDFNEAKYYVELVKKYFVPELQQLRPGDFSTHLTKLIPKCDYIPGTINVKVDATKHITKNFFRLEGEIDLLQKKFGISEANMQEFMNTYHSIARHIDSILLNPENSEKWYDFSFDANAWSPEYWWEPEVKQPRTIQLAHISNLSIKKRHNKRIMSECNSSIRLFCCLPPIEEQYTGNETLENIREKVDTAIEYFNAHRENSPLKEGAIEKIKEHADDACSILISEVKHMQASLNKKLDSVCAKLKAFF